MRITNFARAGKLCSRPIYAAALLMCVAVSLSASLIAQVSVTISPSTVTMATLAAQSFSATVSGSTNTAVTWQVNGISGGNSTNGLLSTTVLGSTNEAIYLAPSSVPSPASVSVTAISQADSTKSATATVTIQLPSRSGTTYYVSTSGNDNNAGTLERPLAHHPEGRQHRKGRRFRSGSRRHLQRNCHDEDLGQRHLRIHHIPELSG